MGNSKVYMHNHSEANPKGKKSAHQLETWSPRGLKILVLLYFAGPTFHGIEYKQQTDAQVQKYKSMYPAVVSNKLGPASPPLPAYFLL